MEILVLAFVGLALALTVGVILLKVLWFLVLLPFKLLGAIGAGLLSLMLIPLLFVGGLVACAGFVAALALLPVIVPVVVVGAVLFAIVC